GVGSVYKKCCASADNLGARVQHDVKKQSVACDPSRGHESCICAIQAAALHKNWAKASFENHGLNLVDGLGICHRRLLRHAAYLAPRTRAKDAGAELNALPGAHSVRP